MLSVFGVDRGVAQVGGFEQPLAAARCSQRISQLHPNHSRRPSFISLLYARFTMFFMLVRYVLVVDEGGGVERAATLRKDEMRRPIESAGGISSPSSMFSFWPVSTIEVVWQTVVPGPCLPAPIAMPRKSCVGL
jgi:hypothetical protein